MGAFIELTAQDGHHLSVWLSKPQGKPKAGLVVLQEIFGLNQHICNVTDRFAAQGYLAVAPALFDRLERGFESGYDMSKDRAMELNGATNWDNAMLDIDVAWSQVASAGKVGVVGYCLGGLMAYLSACRLRFDAAVCYYGHLEKAKDEFPKCPLIGHFGSLDQNITPGELAEFRDAHPEVPIHLYPAGHGFACDERASYDEAAAELAAARTAEFLAQHLLHRRV